MRLVVAAVEAERAFPMRKSILLILAALLLAVPVTLAQTNEVCAELATIDTSTITLGTGFSSDDVTIGLSLNTGLSSYQAGQYDLAIQMFQLAVDAVPDFATTYLYRGCAYAAQGNTTSATADWQRFVQLSDDTAMATRVQVLLGGSSVPATPVVVTTPGPVVTQEAGFGGATATPEAGVDTVKGQLGTTFEQDNTTQVGTACERNLRPGGNLLFGSQEEAQILINSFNANNATAENYLNRGEAYVCLGNYETGMTDFDTAISLNPNYIDAYTSRGRVYLDFDFHQEAINDFTRAIQLNANDPNVYNNRGLAYYESQQYDLALSDYNTALRLDPNLATVYNNRGYLYENTGDYDSALIDYNRALELNPDNPYYYYDRGMLRVFMEDTVNGFTDLQTAITMLPTEPFFYADRGYAFGLQSDYNSAITDYNTALSLNPQFVIALYRRGFAYYQLGNYNTAITDFSAVIQLDPNYDLAYYGRGYANRAIGNTAAALADFQAFLRIYPNAPEAAEVQQLIAELGGGTTSGTK